MSNTRNISELPVARETPKRDAGRVVPRDDGDYAQTRQIGNGALQHALTEGASRKPWSNLFTFNDHALRLEFTDKTRLTEYLEKSRELFPDTTLEISFRLESGDHAIAEWRLSATESVPLGSVSHRVPISLQGSTIICVANGRIVRWSQYYDQSSSLPISLGSVLHRVD